MFEITKLPGTLFGTWQSVRYIRNFVIYGSVIKSFECSEMELFSILFKYVVDDAICFIMQLAWD